MVMTRDDLLARLDDLGIATETFEHPPVFTVEEARTHCGHLPGGHCKNLFLKDKKGRLWLIVTLESQPIDLKALNQALGAARFSFGKPELLFETLGVTPGSVTPFALINDLDLRVSVVLDAAMMAMERLNYHPLSNDATTAITPQGPLDLITSFGHQARIFDFSSLE